MADDMSLYDLTRANYEMLRILAGRVGFAAGLAEHKANTLGCGWPQPAPAESHTVWVDSEEASRMEDEKMKRLGINWVVRIRPQALTESDMQHVLKTGDLPKGPSVEQRIASRLSAILWPGAGHIPDPDLECILGAVKVRIDEWNDLPAGGVNAVRDAALEEAAAIAAKYQAAHDKDSAIYEDSRSKSIASEEIAKHIRALKSKPAPQVAAPFSARQVEGLRDLGVTPEPIHDFGWALAQMRAGKTVTRDGWASQNVLSAEGIDKGWVQLGRGRLSFDAMLATDWKVVP
jgi:hypothetical protein